MDNSSDTNKYDDFVKNSPIPLLEMDFSLVSKLLGNLQFSSSVELKDLFYEDPLILSAFKSSILITNLNDSAKSIFGTKSVEDLDLFFSNIFLKSDPIKIVKMAVQMMKGDLKGDFEWEINTENKRFDTHIYWYLPSESRYDLSNVFISIFDITKNKEYQYELIQQSTLQKVINSIYALGLQNLPIQEIFDRVVRLVAQFMDAEFCKIMKYRKNTNDLIFISGYGWGSEFNRDTIIPADESLQGGYTINNDSLMVVNDLLNDPRFTGHASLMKYNVRSGISTTIKTDDEIYGIIGVHSTKVNNFSIYSIEFFNSIALFLSNLLTRENVQNKLTASKLLYEDLYRTAPFMYFNIEFNTGKILNFNNEVVNALGYSKEELEDKLITEIYHPSSFAKLDDEIIKLIKRGKVKDVEFRVIKRDGTIMDVLINAIGIKDNTGKLVLTRSIWMDITETNAAKLKIIEQSEDIQNINRILNLKNQISEVVLFTKNENELNQKVCDILGRDETIKFTWIGYLGYDRLRSIEPIAFSEDYTSYQQLFDYRSLTDDGGTYPISRAVKTEQVVVLNQQYMHFNCPQELDWLLEGETKSIIILPLVVDNLCIGILSISSLIDYTTDDSSEINLFKEIASTLAFTIKAIRVEKSQLMVFRELENEKIQSLKLLTAIEQSSNIILITDPYGHIEYTNPKFTEISGYGLDEVITQNPSILKSDLKSNDYYTNLWSTISGGNEWQGEFMNKKKDGSYYWVYASIAPVIDDSGEIINYIGIQTDITEQKRNESKLHEMQKMEAIGRLAAGISHDFKNILTAIALNTDFIESNLNILDPLREETKEIRKGINMATSTIQQLLAFSGSSEIADYVEIDLVTIVDKLLTWTQRLVGPNIDIVKDKFCDKSIILGNKSSAEQMLINLIINAKDAMPSGGIISINLSEIINLDGHLQSKDETIHEVDVIKEILLEMTPDKSYYLLNITDNGTGISKETIQYIFEPYFTTKGPGKGTGLGLSTVYSIVNRFGGSIHVTSEVGIGTSFMILLPKFEQSTGN